MAANPNLWGKVTDAMDRSRYLIVVLSHLATDVEGKVWLFTLGPKGTPTHGGSMVTEIGPLVDVSAPEYLLSIYHAVAAPGAKSGVHTHPGTEAFYVLEGQLSQQTPHGVNVVEAGKTLAGGPPSIRWRSPTAAGKNCIG